MSCYNNEKSKQEHCKHYDGEPCNLEIEYNRYSCNYSKGYRFEYTGEYRNPGDGSVKPIKEEWLVYDHKDFYSGETVYTIAFGWNLRPAWILRAIPVCKYHDGEPCNAPFGDDSSKELGYGLRFEHTGKHIEIDDSFPKDTWVLTDEYFPLSKGKIIHGNGWHGKQWLLRAIPIEYASLNGEAMLVVDHEYKIPHEECFFRCRKRDGSEAVYPLSTLGIATQKEIDRYNEPEFKVGDIVVVDNNTTRMILRKSLELWATQDKKGKIWVNNSNRLRHATPDEINEFYTVTGKNGERARFYKLEGNPVKYVDAKGRRISYCGSHDIQLEAMLNYFGIHENNEFLIMPYKKSQGNYKPPKEIKKQN